jgi:hypothetical protein
MWVCKALNGPRRRLLLARAVDQIQRTVDVDYTDEGSVALGGAVAPVLQYALAGNRL